MFYDNIFIIYIYIKVIYFTNTNIPLLFYIPLVYSELNYYFPKSLNLKIVQCLKYNKRRYKYKIPINKIFKLQKKMTAIFILCLNI